MKEKPTQLYHVHTLSVTYITCVGTYCHYFVIVYVNCIFTAVVIWDMSAGHTCSCGVWLGLAGEKEEFLKHVFVAFDL